MSSAASVSVGARLWMGRMLFAPVRCDRGHGVRLFIGLKALHPNPLQYIALSMAAWLLSALDRGAALHHFSGI